MTESQTLAIIIGIFMSSSFIIIIIIICKSPLLGSSFTRILILLILKSTDSTDYWIYKRMPYIFIVNLIESVESVDLKMSKIKILVN